ncbi:SDR family oxidoreductase [Paludisphaera mucosa]|uniref:SDR family oxidoreductase n=1 Tax=Paludisphaera mucosa TaxID=3030827 RepID=A0ABT6F4D1_9BACT|nr:SDR family oxidoreductase [Paludisphaera mucosa]MDG3002445.1 SDR family oxidoreductase [Paludisphaera mucosa]
MTQGLFDLTGRRVLITGSNGGLGLGIAGGLAALGARVILNGRDEAKLRAAADGLRAAGLVVEEARFDVTVEPEVVAAVERLEADGPIDVLINNAGIQRRVRLDEIGLDVWDEVLRTNLTSAMLVSRQVARAMIARGRGKVVNIGSVMSDLARTTTGAYAAAKGGLKMLTKAMCADWGPLGLQVNAIGPGYFATDMTRPLMENPEFNAWVTGRTPARRWGRPEELVGVAAFLSSSASDFVNGQILYVDGGVTAVL